MLPDIFFNNKITPYLDEIRYEYFSLIRGIGNIYGLMTIDSDAKIIALDTRFDPNFEIMNICAIGAALYGIAKQGGDLWNEKMKKGGIEYDKKKIFVHSLGLVNFKKSGVSREILIVALVDIDIKDGLIIHILNNYCDKLKKEVKESDLYRPFILMKEPEYQKTIEKLKKDGLFSSSVNAAVP